MESLSKDCIILILKSLAIDEIGCVARLNKLFYISANDEELWKYLARVLYPSLFLDRNYRLALINMFRTFVFIISSLTKVFNWLQPFSKGEDQLCIISDNGKHAQLLVTNDVILLTSSPLMPSKKYRWSITLDWKICTNRISLTI
jgi:hypothetical protein